MENSKESTKELLELASEFSKVTGYKINHKHQLYFYRPAMNTWKPELKISIICNNSKKEMLGINLTKTHTASVAQDCKTLMKEINKDLNKWKDTPFSLGRRNRVKMFVVPKLIYIFSAIPINQNHICLHIQIMQKRQRTRIAKNYLEKKKVMIKWPHDPIYF